MREKLYAPAQSLHQACGGRITHRDNLHLTLVFLGNVEREKIPQLEALAAQQRISRFDLEFGVTGYWRHNRIIWAAPAATPNSLRELVAALERALRSAGFNFDLRSYAPHITLVRDARAPKVLPPLEFEWRVGEFALVESARGYRVLARRALES